eukprot:4995194-Pyramimonas_sp.AAC.1
MLVRPACPSTYVRIALVVVPLRATSYILRSCAHFILEFSPNICALQGPVQTRGAAREYSKKSHAYEHRG